MRRDHLFICSVSKSAIVTVNVYMTGENPITLLCQGPRIIIELCYLRATESYKRKSKTKTLIGIITIHRIMQNHNCSIRLTDDPNTSFYVDDSVTTIRDLSTFSSLKGHMKYWISPYAVCFGVKGMTQDCSLW